MSIVSGIMGASATKSAANTAAGAQISSTELGVEASLEMFDKAAKVLQPYIDAGYRGLAEYEAAPSGAEAPDLPEFEGEFDFEFDPDDPTYKLQQEDLERSVNRSLAARGGYNSRMGVNALADANRRLIADETGRQYGRAVDEYGRAVDEYGREYGKATDEYNIENALTQQNLNKWFALANVGRGTATATGQIGSQTGGQISQAYQSQGNALSNIYSDEGRQLSNVYQNVVPNAIGSAYYGTKAYNAYSANQNNATYASYAKQAYGGGTTNLFGPSNLAG